MKDYCANSLVRDKIIMKKIRLEEFLYNDRFTFKAFRRS